MRISAPLATALFLAAAGILSAAPVTYSLGGTFTDGATLSGSITLDSTTGTLVSFHVVTQFNAGDGIGGITYDSATGTGSIQSPISPPAVAGTYFAILLSDAAQINFLNLIFAGSPATFHGGPVVPSVPVQVGGSLLSAEEDFNLVSRRTVSPAGTFLSPPPTPVPAMSRLWILVAMVLLGAIGAQGTARFALRP